MSSSDEDPRNSILSAFTITGGETHLQRDYRAGKPKTWNLDTPLSKWRSVTLDSNDKVTSIHCFGSEMRGSLDILKLPTTLKKLQLESHRLSFTMNFQDLGRHLPHLEHIVLSRLTWNDVGIVGTWRSECLPRNLVILKLSGNALSGRLDFSTLPPLLTELDVANNTSLTGTPDFSRCPCVLTLTKCFLEGCDFDGVMDLTYNFPPNLTALTVFKGNPKLKFKLDLARCCPTSLMYTMSRGRGMSDALAINYWLQHYEKSDRFV